jgi:archaeal type IV pilus assembly protein PilA
MFKNTEYGDGPHCYDTNGPWDWQTSPLKYTGGCPALWQLCFRNPDNAGKVFTLQATDRKGNLISKADVKITP